MVRKAYGVRVQENRVNIIGIRAADMTPNVFNDYICLLWMNPYHQWQMEYYKATTDPGTYWLLNPPMVEGTAILKEGRYVESHELGLHRGEYPALVQRKKMFFFRDVDRDLEYDLDPSQLIYDIIGCNIHRAHHELESTNVNKWSAACQVIAHPDNFVRFIDLCEISKDLYGNRFDYTLLNERDLI